MTKKAITKKKCESKSCPEAGRFQPIANFTKTGRSTNANYRKLCRICYNTYHRNREARLRHQLKKEKPIDFFTRIMMTKSWDVKGLKKIQI